MVNYWTGRTNPAQWLSTVGQAFGRPCHIVTMPHGVHTYTNELCHLCVFYTSVFRAVSSNPLLLLDERPPTRGGGENKEE